MRHPRGLVCLYFATYLLTGCGGTASNPTPHQEPNPNGRASTTSGSVGQDAGEGGADGTATDASATATTSHPGAASASNDTTTGSAGAGGQPPAPGYTNSDCIDEHGPTEEVASSGIGAFIDDANWANGWTNWSADSSPEADCGGELTPIGTTGDRTLTLTDSPYVLDDVTEVADGETLTIEPGVVIGANKSGTLVVLGRRAALG